MRQHHSRRGTGIRAAVLTGLALLTGACDKAQLLAPTQSTITISAPTRILPSGGSTEITAAVMEQAGTPAHNGTTVRFSTTLGRLDPVEAQTRNGVAVTRFYAGDNSGVAQIQASSGAASGGESNLNRVEITIGAAAVNTVSVRANPGSVGPNGGEVELIATVVGENGQALQGVIVTFNADQGSLSSTTSVTTADGEARTRLTTSQQTVVTATAGTRTSTAVTIAARPGPIVSISCTPAAGGAGTNCAAVQATTANNTATVLFTVTKPTGSSNLRTATLDFGDGTSQALGNLAGGTASVTHSYNGPSGSAPQPYTATLLATDVTGESASVSVSVVIIPRTPISVGIAGTSGGAPTASGHLWSFTATVTGGGETSTGNTTVANYEWDFGDGSTATTSAATTAHVYATSGTEQRRVVTVTIRTQDGRTASGRTEILVGKFP